MIVRSTAPGTPSRLTNIMVKKLSPIWKEKKLPTKLITRIITAPIKELRNSFIITFNGTMKILQSTKIMARPEIYVKILISSNS